MSQERPRRSTIPESVRNTLDDFSESLGVRLQLRATDPEGEAVCLYPGPTCGPLEEPTHVAPLNPRDGLDYELFLSCGPEKDGPALARLVARVTERTLDFAKEVRFFTLELSERFEEINLLYSISETLGSILSMDEAGRFILAELCDVLGARRGSLWVLDQDRGVLELTASVGEGGATGPIAVDDPAAVTARVFRDGRSLIATREMLAGRALPGVVVADNDSFLSVPIRYTPPSGGPKTVGVINLIGRRHGGRFTAADQKLLAAIASQVGAALENNRLLRQSVARERMAREMELAHNLQQKLLPPVDHVPGARVSARVEPAELVGGDFYQVFRLGGGRVGVMIGDVSTHGFPAALIMALAMSAASIYAGETNSPTEVLRRMDDALQEELETTEMYLSLFYGILDPGAGTLVFSNAGHPHAFLVRGEGEPVRLLATDPPVGFAGPDAYGESQVEWDPGSDRLLLFTDGLSDSLTSADRPDGEAFVLRTVREHHHGSPQ
ncbi:MAG TPA: GAF domain-containing SpoIIE family protein phosphatase, partial [Longimicrobiales bacterium]|nr:GAF domain-containing SpoIIE family protein phosphatase [Longimicrobiales bacterium]